MGTVLSSMYTMYNEYFPPKPRWSTGDIPDMKGKVVIVTGGSSGIGRDCVRALLEHNATVYVFSRTNPNPSPSPSLHSETGSSSSAIWIQTDLSDLADIRRAVEEFTSKEKELHVLFNNAGVMMPDMEEVTKQGFDLQFGVNVLGHFHLTTLLLPTLLSTASKTDTKVRVINTSSSGHTAVQQLDFMTFRGKDNPRRRGVGSFGLYLQSKFGNIVFSNELARRYGDKGLVSVSLNPGNLWTGLQRYTPWYVLLLTRWIFYPSEMGALTQLWAGTSPEGEDFNGRYLIPWARLGEASPSTQDSEQAKELWNWMEEQVRDYVL